MDIIYIFLRKLGSTRVLVNPLTEPLEWDDSHIYEGDWEYPKKKAQSS